MHKINFWICQACYWNLQWQTMIILYASEMKWYPSQHQNVQKTVHWAFLVSLGGGRGFILCILANCTACRMAIFCASVNGGSCFEQILMFFEKRSRWNRGDFEKYCSKFVARMTKIFQNWKKWASEERLGHLLVNQSYLISFHSYLLFFAQLPADSGPCTHESK